MSMIGTELVLYFFFYAFLGWIIEVGIFAVVKRKFCNRGILNLPLCISYGFIMDCLILVLPTLKERYLFQFLLVLIVSSAVRNLEGFWLERISRKYPIQETEYSIFSGNIKQSTISLILAFFYYLLYLLLHPVVFMVSSLIPSWIQNISAIVITVLVVFDMAVLLFILNIKQPNIETEKFQEKSYETKNKIGRHIYQWVWRRIRLAYPEMERVSEKEQLERPIVFAKGVCFDKVVWVFFISAFLGDIIETLYCRAVAGIWMSRSSVIYGMFSIVWGIGAALLTIVLQKVANKDDRHVFLAGFLLGGAYEYLCSVFTEVFFGTVFWDYSDMKFNIGGRTNLLFCFFWGVLAVVWIKICYPVLSRWIEKIPVLLGKVTTWSIIVFMTCNMLISAAAMVRYTVRMENPTANTAIEEFLDRTYDDALVERIWPNMKLTETDN